MKIIPLAFLQNYFLPMLIKSRYSKSHHAWPDITTWIRYKYDYAPFLQTYD